MAGLGGDEELVAVGTEVFLPDTAEVLLGRAGDGAVVVGEVEVADAVVEGVEYHTLGLGEVVNGAEVVPKAEGQDGEEDAGAAGTPSIHQTLPLPLPKGRGIDTCVGHIAKVILNIFYQELQN